MTQARGWYRLLALFWVTGACVEAYVEGRFTPLAAGQFCFAGAFYVLDFSRRQGRPKPVHWRTAILLMTAGAGLMAAPWLMGLMGLMGK